jgi:hypothetical protein
MRNEPQHQWVEARDVRASFAVSMISLREKSCQPLARNFHVALPPCGYAGLSATPPQPPAGCDPRGFSFTGVAA